MTFFWKSEKARTTDKAQFECLDSFLPPCDAEKRLDGLEWGHQPVPYDYVRDGSDGCGLTYAQWSKQVDARIRREEEAKSRKKTHFITRLWSAVTSMIRKNK